MELVAAAGFCKTLRFRTTHHEELLRMLVLMEPMAIKEVMVFWLR
jgi:hypothetical protein